jgi:hypothetical protein
MSLWTRILLSRLPMAWTPIGDVVRVCAHGCLRRNGIANRINALVRDGFAESRTSGGVRQVRRAKNTGNKLPNVTRIR